MQRRTLAVLYGNGKRTSCTLVLCMPLLIRLNSLAKLFDLHSSPSQGLCCSLNCDFKAPGTPCEEESDCEMKSGCTGASPFCPAPSPKANMTICSLGTRVCLQGVRWNVMKVNAEPTIATIVKIKLHKRIKHAPLVRGYVGAWLLIRNTSHTLCLKFYAVPKGNPFKPGVSIALSQYVAILTVLVLVESCHPL